MTSTQTGTSLQPQAPSPGPDNKFFLESRFRAPGATASDKPVIRGKMSRGKVQVFLSGMLPCLIVKEAQVESYLLGAISSPVVERANRSYPRCQTVRQSRRTTPMTRPEWSRRRRARTGGADGRAATRRLSISQKQISGLEAGIRSRDPLRPESTVNKVDGHQKIQDPERLDAHERRRNSTMKTDIPESRSSPGRRRDGRPGSIFGPPGPETRGQSCRDIGLKR